MTTPTTITVDGVDYVRADSVARPGKTNAAKTDRNATIVHRVTIGGESYGAVASAYGISRERVREIVERERYKQRQRAWLRRERTLARARHFYNRAEVVTVDEIFRRRDRWAAARPGGGSSRRR